MTIKASHVLDPKTWRAGWHFLRAMVAYQKRDFAAALKAYDQTLKLDRLRTADRMVFYAHLLVLNRQPAERSIEIYRQVASGEYSDRDEGSRYARALARYWLAFLLNQPEVVALWLDAYRLKPKKGWASSFLDLPDKPFLK